MSRAKEFFTTTSPIEEELKYIQLESDRLGRTIYLRTGTDPRLEVSSVTEARIKFIDYLEQAKAILNLGNFTDQAELSFLTRYFYDNPKLDDKTGSQWQLQLPLWYYYYFSNVSGRIHSLAPTACFDLRGRFGWRIGLQMEATQVHGLRYNEPTAIAIPLEGLITPSSKDQENGYINDDEDKIYQKHQNLKFPIDKVFRFR